MLSHLFARRYLFSPNSRSVINFISGLSVLAVAMPVAAMIILLSVFNGFGELVRSMYSAFDAPITISARRGQSFGSGEIDTAAISKIPGVAALSYTLEQSALLEHDGRQATATIRGVDDHYQSVLPLNEAITAGSFSPRLGDFDRLIIGQAMAHMLGIRTLVDTDINLYSVRRGSISMLLPIDNFTRRSLPVEGLFSLDMESERGFVVTSLRLAQQLFNYPDRVSSLIIAIKPGANTQLVRRQLEAHVGDQFKVQTREELRASFYQIMTYEKWGIFLIASLVMLIASFSVVGALAMLIVDKRVDAQTLRSMGANTSLIRSIFRAEGLLICSIGGGAGVILGVGATLIQQYAGIIEIPADTFLTKSYPVLFRLSDLAAILTAFALVAILLTNITVRSMIKEIKR